MPRRRLIVIVSAAAILSMVVLVLLVAVSITQTSGGREWVMKRFVRPFIASRMLGKVHLGHVEGNLLTGFTIDSLEIRDRHDSLFAATGPLSVTYDPRDLFDRRLLIRSLTVVRPFIHIKQDEDGTWSWREVMKSSQEKKKERRVGRRFGDFVVIDSLVAHGARFVLSMPWHPDDSLHGVKRDSAIRTALNSKAREIRPDYSQGKLTYNRVYRWSSGELVAPHIRVADPDSVGMLFRVAALSVNETDPPFKFRNVRGDIRMLRDSAWLDLPHFDLPGSTGSAKGKVWWGSDMPVRYDIHVHGDSVSLADVAWTYPTLPTTGSGRMDLEIRNEGLTGTDLNLQIANRARLRVIDYAIRNMDVRSTASHLIGDMTFGVGDTVLITKDVNLRADPVDFALLRTLNGKPFPYPWRGAITGTVKARGGRLDRFIVDDAKFTFRDANARGAYAAGTAHGKLNILFPAFTEFLGLDVDITHADLSTYQFLNPAFPRLKGYIAGKARLDSSWLDVRVSNADVRHFDGPGEPSHVTGTARVTWQPKFMKYDVVMDASPLNMTTIARSYTASPIRGNYSGPIRARGTIEDLDLSGSLRGPGGEMEVNGHFDFFPPQFIARATGAVRGLDLQTLFQDPTVPHTNLTMRYTTDLAGDSLPNLVGTLGLDLERSRLDSLRLWGGAARLRFANGVMHIDTLGVESPTGTLRATGALAMDRPRADSVVFLVRLDSLGGLRSYLATGEDSLAGDVTLRGTLRGWAKSLDASASILAHDVFVGTAGSHEVRATLTARDLTGNRRISGTVLADSAIVSGIRMQTARIFGQLDRDNGSMQITASSGNGQQVDAGMNVAFARDTSIFAIDRVRLQLGKRVWQLASPARVTTTPSGMSVDSLVLRGTPGERVALRASLPSAGNISLAIDADSLALADVGELAQVTVPLQGRLSARWRVNGTRDDPRMNFGADITDAVVSGVKVSRARVRGAYANRRLADTLELYRAATKPALVAVAELPVDLALKPVEQRLAETAPLHVDIRSDSVELGILETFTDAVQRARGSLTANVQINGTWRQPKMAGQLAVTNGEMTLPGLGVRVLEMQSAVRFNGDSIVLSRFRARSGDERADSLSLAGSIDLRDRENPRFDLRLFADNFHVIARPRLADLDISTSRRALQLTGSMRGSRLSGVLEVPRGVIYIPELAQKRVESLDDSALFAIVDTSLAMNRRLLPDAPPELVKNLVLDNMRIAIGDNVYLRSAEANLKLGGAVNLTTTAGREGGEQSKLALEGRVNVERGRYRLNIYNLVQRDFELESGSIDFTGGAELNPDIDIRAIHTVRQFGKSDRDVRIRAHITGTLDQPQLSLESADNLAYSQSELISYLVTGQPNFEVSTQAGLGVLLPTLGSTLGSANLGLDDFSVITSSSLNTDPKGVSGKTGSLLQGTRVGGGKQIGNRTYVSANAGLCAFGRAVGEGERLDPVQLWNSIGLKVDYRLKSDVSLSAGIEPPTSALFCATGQNVTGRGFVPTPRQFGFDLFKRWEF